ncbi:MAG: hypothetical protein QXV17_12770, partial [Candidatus Micrarchaeaceae archaeon]
MNRNKSIQYVAILIVFLFLMSSFSSLSIGNSVSNQNKLGPSNLYNNFNYTSSNDLSALSNYKINNIYYYPNYNSLAIKVVSTVNGFYIIGNDITLFKSPNLQIPLKTTPGWGYDYSDAFVDKNSILSNNSIYILGNGFYYNGGGGLFIWKIFVNNGTLIDVSNLLPSSWTVIGNNQFWLTGAYGNHTLALAENNYNRTECNIVLIKNGSIVDTIKNPLGYTGSNQQPSMAYADGEFLFLAPYNGKTLAALIGQNGTVVNVTKYFNSIGPVNANSGLLGIDNVFVIAAGSTYIFNPSTLNLKNIKNFAQVGIISGFNSTTVILGGIESQNFTLELLNMTTYNVTQIFSTSNISFLTSLGSLSEVDLGYYNGTILIAGPFPDQYGPLNTINLKNVNRGNVTFNINPKNAWFTIDQCLCGNDMAEIALPLDNGTFIMKNAIYGEYYVYAQSPYYQDYYGPIFLNSSNEVINITLKKGELNTTESYPWFPVGPHNITIQFLNYQVAQYSAHIGLFAINVENPDIIYAASSVGPGMTGPMGDGGIFKTVDGGKIWMPVDFGLPYGTVTGLYINESDPNELIAGVADAGIYKTDDGGSYWYKVSNFTDAIDISYSNGKLFAGSGEGIIESTNSGNTWKIVEPTTSEVNSISVSHNVIYALLNNLTLMKSSNLGLSWSIVYKFNGDFPYTVRASPFNSSILYVTIGGGRVYANSTKIPTSVPTFYSDNGGITFTPVTALPVKTVVFDPLNSSILWAVGYPDLYSLNGGQSFYATFLTVDNMAIYVDPVNDSILLAGSDQGIYESNDKGITWYPINGNLIDELSDAVSITPNGSRILLSMQDLGTYMSYNNGDSWFSVHMGPENSLVYINPYNDSWIYSFDRGNSAPLRVSDNGGLSTFEIPYVFSPSYQTGNELFAVNSSNGRDVLVGTESGLYYSNNYGKNWSLLPGSPRNITSLQYVNNNEIVVGTTNGVFVFNGKTWIESYGISNIIYSVTVDPGNNNIIAVAGGWPQANLYLSYNRGYNFTLVNTSISSKFLYSLIPVQFYFLNVTGYPLIATTNFGIYLSENFGENWSDISYNLYSGQVDDLVFEDGNLYIATYGSGLEEIQNFSLSNLPGTINGDVFSNMNITLNGQNVPVYDGHFRIFLKPGNYILNISGNNFLQSHYINVKPMGVYYVNLTTNLTFKENGLPEGTNWSVSLNGKVLNSSKNMIIFSVPNGYYSYKIPNVLNFYAVPNNGYLDNLSWPNDVIYLTFYEAPLYKVIFTEKGLPIDGLWDINLNGKEYVTESNNQTVYLMNGTYSYSINSKGYFPLPESGKFTINGGVVIINITFYYFSLLNITGYSGYSPGWQANTYYGDNGFLTIGGTFLFFNNTLFRSPQTPGAGFYLSASWNGKYFFVVGQKWAPIGGVYAGLYYPQNNSFIDLTGLFPTSLSQNASLRSVAWNGSVFLILGARYLNSSTGLTILYEYNPSTNTLKNITYELPQSFKTVQDCCGSLMENIVSVNQTFFIMIENNFGVLLGKIYKSNFTNLTVYLPSHVSLYIDNYDFMKVYNESMYIFGKSKNGGPSIFSINLDNYKLTFYNVTFPSNTQIIAGTPFSFGYVVTISYGNSYGFYLIYNNSINFESFSVINITSIIPIYWGDLVTISFGDGKIFVGSTNWSTNKQYYGIIPLHSRYYNVTFIESNLNPGTTWYVNLTNGQFFESQGNTISFQEPNGTYSYTVATSDHTYRPSPSSGSFTVNGASVSESITFSLVTYTVTFTESGLPSGTTWSVTLNGITESSTTNTISFLEPNGTYIYSIGGISGYRVNAYNGTIIVNGGALNNSVVWSIVTYPITITQSGIPSGTTWSVTLSGTAFNGQYVNSTLESSTGTITFNEPNGSYTYTVH